MLKFVGNCNDIINWNEVIAGLQEQTPAYVGPRHDVGHEVPGVEEVAGQLRDAGYKMKHEGGNASWEMYLPETNFDKSVVEGFVDKNISTNNEGKSFELPRSILDLENKIEKLTLV